MRNAMSVDVEDYFQVSAFESRIKRDVWDELPARVEQNTNKILDIFGERRISATFFVLGWIAERYPQLVMRIVEEGHELASHGYGHVRVTQQRPREFRDDVSRSKDVLEDVAGVPVLGYRAPSYSIGVSNLWAFDELVKAGYRYSSSVYPIRHDLYGMPSAPRFTFCPGKSEFREIPISTVRLGNRNVPCGGGGYFRLFPYPISRWAIRQVNNKDGQPCIFYFHPWEIDPNQPKQCGLNAITRFRHYHNIGRLEGRLKRLLSDFKWGRIDSVFLRKEQRC